jgi:hypothetical protein
MRIHAWFDGLSIDKSAAFLTLPQIVNLQTFKPSNLHMRNMHHIRAIRFVPNQYAPYKGLDDMGDITNRRFDMNGLIFPRKIRWGFFDLKKAHPEDFPQTTRAYK